MKKLIIAEKPSQAKEYAKALGGFSNKDGYLENEEYYIAWCFGHLIELEKDSVYRKEGKWDKSYLPLIPSKYQYKIGSDSNGKIDSGKKKQVALIEKLMKSSKEIINATDADREGELIFLYVYNFLQSKLPYKRLWISSLTEGDIRKGFKNLLDSKEVFHLGKSAYARAIADWLVGVNGTQASTLQFGKGTLLTIGRVQTAILKIICERYIKNKSFEKTFTYKIRANHTENVEFHSESDIYETKAEAEEVLKNLLKIHNCKKIEKNNQNQNAPLLFSIDTLIIEANKKFGYTGQETLDTAQSLYEKKLTSYPRTDSEYINNENYERMKMFLEKFSNKILNKNFSFSNNIPKSVNDKKLTGSHDAIVLTGEFASLDELNAKEKNIFTLILCRCLQSFSAPAVYEKTKITFENNQFPFFTFSSKLLSPGWKLFEMKEINIEESENLETDQNIDIQITEGKEVKVISFLLKEIESKPPALYSEVNLTKDLTNFGKLLKEESPEKIKEISSNIDINSLQIGTQATRPGIIERLKKLDFIALKSNKFIPTENGLKYYGIFKDLQVSNVITTAIWEMKLKNVAEGKEDISVFYKEITSFTEKIVEDIFTKTSDVSFEKISVSLGNCPLCGGNVIESNKSYGCSNWKKKDCKFTIWKTMFSKKITPAIVTQLLKDKTTKELTNLKSSKGKTFSAKLKLEPNGKIGLVFK